MIRTFYIVFVLFCLPLDLSAQDKSSPVNTPGPITGRPTLRFTPFQDTVYSRALQAKSLNIPPEAIFYADMKFLEAEILRYKKIYGASAEEIIRKNIEFPPEYFLPSPVEQTLYQYNLMQSQFVPFVRTYNPFGPKIPLSTIGALLGLSEDVSPVLYYTLDKEENVKIAIYSERALVVRILYEGRQSAGNYQILWDGKDNEGRRMLRGDYIGEVRIGENKYVRKRIRIE